MTKTEMGEVWCVAEGCRRFVGETNVEEMCGKCSGKAMWDVWQTDEGNE